MFQILAEAVPKDPIQTTDGSHPKGAKQGTASEDITRGQSAFRSRSLYFRHF
jgi:hypothetical protein